MSLSLPHLILLTWTSLWRNPLRSGLTLVGIFMGVFAVDATLKVRTISTAVMEMELAKREAPRVQVWKWGMTPEDRTFFEQRLTEIEAIATSEFISWNGSVFFEDQEAQATTSAVSEAFISTAGRQLIKGRSFTPKDFRAFRAVTIIDQYLVDQLFEDRDPINQRIYAEGRPYTIIGVVASLPAEGEQRGLVLIPSSIHYALSGSPNFRQLLIRPQSLEQLDPLEKQVKSLVQQRFPQQHFWAGTNIDDILQQRATLNLASQGLALVGLIALFVGGVGIANISIASVMERRAEIGLRLAIGATERDILFQFILEATLLSLVGGVMAIATVHGLTLIVVDQFDLPYRFDPQVAGFSLGAALVVGMGAGFFPAWQASQLDPVRALRS
ncbi:ABC transporter permease [Roseofilum sp. BLCC_M154]|uniref:ABC transporter permease n=1 Tax=Roseofilum acuticapitatum BLCC-M154 TaxID=3022444 RepID=A0ABT7AVH3_9CYAN|nr:FtsX-like permease family protein [Roseofilum acuticapitatum]MDJ1170891.1 ABC transporter permease [Roseofilum acuticapitatum BLCC-M154]